MPGQEGQLCWLRCAIQGHGPIVVFDWLAAMSHVYRAILLTSICLMIF